MLGSSPRGRGRGKHKAFSSSPSQSSTNRDSVKSSNSLTNGPGRSENASAPAKSSARPNAERGGRATRGRFKAATNSSRGDHITSKGASNPFAAGTIRSFGTSNKSGVKGDWNQRYQSLKAYRDGERADAIKNGFLADPEKPRTLAEAITPTGTCSDMCAEFERVQRVVQSDVWGPEKDANKNPDESRMVKKFRRAAAGIDEQLPSDLRPPLILKKTLDFLIHDVISNAESLADVHHFVWDRTRAIRNDFSIQQITKVDDLHVTIECFERIARFHIMSLHHFTGMKQPYDQYTAQQEREQLDKTLLSLIQYYDDSRARLQSANEPEFRAYCIIFQIQSPVPNLAARMQHWPDWVVAHPAVRTAVRLYNAATNTLDSQGPLKPTARHFNGQEDWRAFWAILESRKSTFLMACVAEIYFPAIRKAALTSIWNGYRKGTANRKNDDWSLDDATYALGMDDEDSVQSYLKAYGFSILEHEDGISFVDLGSLHAKSLSDPSIPLFASYLIEKKRRHRTFWAIVDGLSTKASRNAGQVSDDDDEEESSNEIQDASFDSTAPTFQRPAASASVTSFGQSPNTSAPSANDFKSLGLFGLRHSDAPTTPDRKDNTWKEGSPVAFAKSDASKAVAAPSLFNYVPIGSLSVASDSKIQDASKKTPEVPAAGNPLTRSAETPSSLKETAFGTFSTSKVGQSADGSFTSRALQDQDPPSTLPRTPGADFTFGTSTPEKPLTQKIEISSLTPKAAPNTYRPKQSSPLSQIHLSAPEHSRQIGKVEIQQEEQIRETTNPFSSAIAQARLGQNPFAPSSSNAPQESSAPIQTLVNERQPFNEIFGSAQQKDARATPSVLSEPGVTSVGISQIPHFKPVSQPLFTTVSGNRAESQPLFTTGFGDQTSIIQSAPPFSQVAAPKITDAEPLAISTPAKPDLYDRLARLMLFRSHGILEEFIEHKIGGMVTQARQKVAEDMLKRQAAEFRLRKLSERYGRRWRNIVYTKRVRKQGAERRQRQRKHAEVQAQIARESSISAQLEAFREAQESRRKSVRTSRPPPASTSAQSSAFGSSILTNQPTILNATSSQPAKEPRSTGHFRSQSAYDGQTRNMRPPSSTASMTRSLQEMFRPTPAPSDPLLENLATPREMTSSVYFQLRARGLDPSSSTLFPQGHGVSRKRYRSTSMDDAEPPSRKRSQTLPSTNEELHETEHLLEGGDMTPTKPTTEVPEQADQLLASVRQVRNALAEGESWFKSSVTRLSQSPSPASSQRPSPGPSHYRSKYADILQQNRSSHLRNSLHSSQTSSFRQSIPNAHTNRVSKFLSREAYPEALRQNTMEDSRQAGSVLNSSRPAMIRGPRQSWLEKVNARTEATKRAILKDAEEDRKRLLEIYSKEAENGKTVMKEEAFTSTQEAGAATSASASGLLEADSSKNINPTDVEAKPSSYALNSPLLANGTLGRHESGPLPVPPTNASTMHNSGSNGHLTIEGALLSGPPFAVSGSQNPYTAFAKDYNVSNNVSGNHFGDKGSMSNSTAKPSSPPAVLPANTTSRKRPFKPQRNQPRNLNPFALLGNMDDDEEESEDEELEVNGATEDEDVDENFTNDENEAENMSGMEESYDEEEAREDDETDELANDAPHIGALSGRLASEAGTSAEHAISLDDDDD